jgi:hypothetical protein
MFFEKKQSSFLILIKISWIILLVSIKDLLVNSWFSKFGFGSPEENARKISFRLGKTENFP